MQIQEDLYVDLSLRCSATARQEVDSVLPTPTHARDAWAHMVATFQQDLLGEKDRLKRLCLWPRPLDVY